MDEKEPKTLEEQLEILKSRGVRIDTNDEYNKAADILKRVGYYKLINGYKRLFIEIPESEETNTIERYKESTSVSEIYSLYLFDRNLQAITLNHILPVETHIKSLLAFTISEQYGNDNYLKYQNFNTQIADAHSKITSVISDIYKQIASRGNDPSIRHYLTKYGFLPMWVLNNILTMGNVSKLYSIMKPADRQSISREFCIQDNTLENFLLYVTKVRNISAHGNRLYCFRSKKPLTDTNTHQALAIEKGSDEFTCGKRDYFAALIALKHLTSNNDTRRLVDEINNALDMLRQHLHTISIDDVKAEMGFPENWWKIKFQNIK